MAEMSPAYGTAIFEPPVACVACGHDVGVADAVVTMAATLGRAVGDHIEVDVRVTSATVTARPCGHVLHQSTPDETTTGDPS